VATQQIRATVSKILRSLSLFPHLRAPDDAPYGSAICHWPSAIRPRRAVPRWAFTCSVALALTFASVMATYGAQATAAASKASPADKQSKLIQVLKSDAEPANKAIACKELAIYGTDAAVPALAPLLANPELASWARIALEAIPGPAPDAALRKATGQLQGRLLVGIINSIGVRRDAEAVSKLGKKLKDQDAEAASAAAVALGRIGGTKAARLLQKSLPSAPDSVRAAVAQGCILCAERFYLQGHAAQAVKLYDAVRQASVPKQKLLEATRGAILARQFDGVPLLLEQLRSPDKAFFGIGLRTARELPGLSVTEALVAELGHSSPDRQPLLLLAVADRDDSAASAAIQKAAAAGATQTRLVAIGALERRSSLATLPVLLDAASGSDAKVAQAALGVLTRLPGSEVDTYFLDRLPQSTGKARQVLIDLAARRRIERALPVIVGFTKDSDAGVRSSAVQAIGSLGDEKQVATLVRLLKSAQAPKDHSDLEAALIAVVSRNGARCVPDLLPLAQSEDIALRIAGLHVLAAAGGPDALAGVTTAIDGKDETLRDEAVRTLSTWPNNWPEESGVAEPLLTLAKFARKPSHQVLGQRAYLQYIQGDKQLKDAEKVAKVKEVQPLLKAPEEQRLAIGVIGGIPTDAALELLATFAADPAIADDACSAMVKLAGDKASAISKAQRQQALQTVVEKSKQDATREKASALMKAIQ
jgi:HEAT repeat protein